MSESWRRHDLLRVEPRKWSEMLASQPHLAMLPHVAPWAARGWPLIVRRRMEGDDTRMIPLAFPLPPACGKLRVAVQLAPEAVRERVAAPTLRVLREEAPPPWHPTVDALLALADHSGIEPGVFGSLLWQRLTGLPYLSAGSDLDLLWPVGDANSANCLVHRLGVLERNSPVRFDGEILLPDGGGVQWREWRDHPAEVLVKTASGVRLSDVRDLFPGPVALT